jgi:hypothetical protein
VKLCAAVSRSGAWHAPRNVLQCQPGYLKAPRDHSIAGGLAWVAFLAVGSIGEQVKTRLEVAHEESGAEDVDTADWTELASSVRFRNLRIGGGAMPRKGDLVVVNYRCTQLAPWAATGPEPV